jgi:hypothetical protein
MPMLSLYAQSNGKLDRYSGEPLLVDSANVVFIPLLYNESLNLSDKLAASGDYYANFIVYHVSKDSYRRLFERDTYILPFPLQNDTRSRRTTYLKVIESDRMFLAVKNNDTNRNGKIDNLDATVIFTSKIDGEEVKQLTEASDNFVKLVLFEKQGFGLMTFQRDSDQDGSFRFNDKEFYLRKLDLKTLAMGQIIEVN